LFGGAAITREVGLAWAEPGVEAHDARDGNITGLIVVTGTVDMNSTGTYLLTYTVQDGAGNTASTTRTVTVVGNRSVDLNATVAMDMIWCPPGTFTMGLTGVADPEHNVTLTEGFYLGKFEVTQAQYEAVMTGNANGLNPTPSHFSGYPNRPVEKVSWNDIHVFLNRINTLESNNIPVGWSCVLPTEAQWEYACRAGTTTAFSWGDDIHVTYANYENNVGQTVDVGQYSPNPWGIFDIHGNVRELCSDWKANYSPENQIDPIGPSSGTHPIQRGGSWDISGSFMRSAHRNYNNNENHRDDGIGFRISLQKSQ
jgi:formylglycine-generating enzyme required for sulfatase activity